MKVPAAIFLLVVLAFLPLRSGSWGFWAHQRINRMAVFTLPPSMLYYYKPNIEYITTHAVDPDKRRYSDPKEAPRHFIDLDYYGKYPFDSLPHSWTDAVKKFGYDTVYNHGIVPWEILLTMEKLTNAFKQKDGYLILKYSDDIGHYIADAHVPLHCSENYNGQMTNQVGIHAFWESRIPELFGDNYDYFIGTAKYIQHPEEYVWKIVLRSGSQIDSVLDIEKKVSDAFPPDQKFTIEQKGTQAVRTYSEPFSEAYKDSLNDMEQRNMRQAIFDVGSFWYTAWVNAGQPDLHHIGKMKISDEQEKDLEAMDQAWKNNSVIGRIEQ